MMKLLINSILSLVVVFSPSMSYSQEKIQRIDISNMVNLATGDLNYSIPLFSVPGSDRDFPLNLRYVAGIKLDQESSWTGLGFVLDPGRISRIISQVPDDYAGNIILTHVTDPGDEKKVDVPTLFQSLIDKINGTFSQAQVDWQKGIGGNTHSIKKSMAEVWQGTALTMTAFGNVYQPLFLNLMSPRIDYKVSSWDWNIEEHHEKRKIWFVTTGWDKSITYKWWLDAMKQEKSYGILYQSKIPTVLPTSGSPNYFNPNFLDPNDDQTPKLYNDVSIEYDGKRSFDPSNYSSDYYQGSADAEIYKNSKPIYWASDQYFVSALDLNGELQPLRFDNSSVATSYNSNVFYDNRIALYKYKLSEAQTGKVQFTFSQNLSNQYSYHKDAFGGNYKLNYSIKPTSNNINYLHQETQPGLNAIKPADDSFNGNNVLYKGVSVKWFSIQEILNNEAKEQGFIDYPNFDRSSDTPSLIGGFMITDLNGYTYHFALPVFAQTYQKTSNNVTTFENFLTTQYASDWLITAITGPNFVDVGNVEGQIDDNDMGWYVKFEYGKYLSDFNERSPKESSLTGDFDLVSRSVSDVYLLNSIRTNTHTAFFLKKTRDDSYSQPESFSIQSDNNKNLLALSEIILLKNPEANHLKSLMGAKYKTGIQGYNGNQENILKFEDIYNNNTIKEYTTANQIKVVKFRYDYSLCQGIPTSKSGKLTLRGLDFVDRGDVSNTICSYKFDYSFNPSYNKESSDAWGLYKNNTVAGADMHKVDNGTDGTAWSLTKVTELTGGQIIIDYGRDKYSSVSGESLETGVKEKWGGDLRVNSIKLIKEGNKISSQFIYDYNNSLDIISSGVITTELPLVKGLHRKVDDIYGYPSTLVTYGTVKKSHFSNDNTSESDNIVRFRFYTADIASTVIVNELLNKTTVLNPDITKDAKLIGYDIHEQAYETVYKYRKIGLMNLMETLDNNSNTIERYEYLYEESDMGSFTQGLHLLDNTYRVSTQSPGEENKKDWRMSYRFINSLSKYVPFRLRQVKSLNYKTNISSTNKVHDFDFYTGNPTIVETTDSYGNTYLSETTPAYRKYGAMGLASNGGKNMLTQEAASYTYKIDPTNSNAKTGLVSASVQTWSDQVPVVQPGQSLSPRYNQTGIWRKKASFSFIGDNTESLTGDGFYSLKFRSIPYFTSWDGNTEPSIVWQKNGEIPLYDVNSHAMEVADINNNHAATKMTFDHTRILVTGANCEYRELAYSGAEEQPQKDQFNLYAFGGNVYCSGTRTNEQFHTGKYSVKANAGSAAFTYYPTPMQGTYVVSFWSSQPTGVVKYQMDNASPVSATVKTIGQAGGWYLLEARISGTEGHDWMKVWNEASSSTTYFDDFRIHPLDAAVTSYVYNSWGELSHILDNNNLYTEYRYDGMGRLKETYKESFQSAYGKQGVVKVNEFEINYSTGNK